MVEVGQWYNSKRGHLCRVEMLHPDGSITVTSHYTGNKVKIWPEDLKFFHETQEPKIPIGTALQIIEQEQKDEYFEIYTRYPHIIPDSIYKVQVNIRGPRETTFKSDGKTRVKKIKSSHKGATRCKIKCQTKKCKGIRDIKVQDAFQVNTCEECSIKRRKEKLRAMLAARKAR